MEQTTERAKGSYEALHHQRIGAGAEISSMSCKRRRCRSLATESILVGSNETSYQPLDGNRAVAL
jgi:hypothetical protein